MELTNKNVFVFLIIFTLIFDSSLLFVLGIKNFDSYFHIATAQLYLRCFFCDKDVKIGNSDLTTYPVFAHHILPLFILLLKDSFIAYKLIIILTHLFVGFSLFKLVKEFDKNIDMFMLFFIFFNPTLLITLFDFSQYPFVLGISFVIISMIFLKKNKYVLAVSSLLLAFSSNIVSFVMGGILWVVELLKKRLEIKMLLSIIFVMLVSGFYIQNVWTYRVEVTKSIPHFSRTPFSSTLDEKRWMNFITPYLLPAPLLFFLLKKGKNYLTFLFWCLSFFPLIFGNNPLISFFLGKYSEIITFEKFVLVYSLSSTIIFYAFLKQYIRKTDFFPLFIIGYFLASFLLLINEHELFFKGEKFKSGIPCLEEKVKTILEILPILNKTYRYDIIGLGWFEGEVYTRSENPYLNSYYFTGRPHILQKLGVEIPEDEESIKYILNNTKTLSLKYVFLLDEKKAYLFNTNWKILKKENVCNETLYVFEYQEDVSPVSSYNVYKNFISALIRFLFPYFCLFPFIYELLKGLFTQ